MKKFIPLLLIGALLTSMSCRQSDELETSTNVMNSNSISMKGIGIVNTTASTNDSLVVSNAIVAEDTKPYKDPDGW